MSARRKRRASDDTFVMFLTREVVGGLTSRATFVPAEKYYYQCCVRSPTEAAISSRQSLGGSTKLRVGFNLGELWRITTNRLERPPRLHPRRLVDDASSSAGRFSCFAFGRSGKSQQVIRAVGIKSAMRPFSERSGQNHIWELHAAHLGWCPPCAV